MRQPYPFLRQSLFRCEKHLTPVRFEKSKGQQKCLIIGGIGIYYFVSNIGSDVVNYKFYELLWLPSMRLHFNFHEK